MAEFAQALSRHNREGWPDLTLAVRDTDIKNRFINGVRSTELKDYLRLHHAELNFQKIVEKARYFVSVMESAKSKKSSVRFVSPDRDPAVHAILPSTSDQSLINCLKAIKNRLDKMSRDQSSARSSTPLARSTSPAPQQSQRSQRGGSPARPPSNYENDQPYDRSGDLPPRRFNNRPSPNYIASPQPRRFQAPSPGWNDPGYRPSTPPPSAWSNRRPRFQPTPPWWSRPGPGLRNSAPAPPSRFGSPTRPSGFGRGEGFGRGRGRGYEGYGRGWAAPQRGEGSDGRDDDPALGPGLNVEPRPGRGRGRGRGCWVCGTWGCYSLNHEEPSYGPQRSSSVSPSPQSQENGPRSPPVGNRAPPTPSRTQSR